MTVLDIINGINELILSDKVTGAQTEILKEARKVLENVSSEEVSQKSQEDVPEKPRETISGYGNRSDINIFLIKEDQMGNQGESVLIVITLINMIGLVFRTLIA